MLRQLVAVVLLLGALGSTSLASAEDDNVMKIKSPSSSIGPKLRTNIALVGAENFSTTIQQDQPNVLVDPSKLFDQASEELLKTDIQEDPQDRFITTRSGKRRVQLADDPENWADDSPVNPYPTGKVLIRKKRCGGGGGGADDGTASRARRARRTRRTRKNRVQRQRRRERIAARKAAKTRTTTITRTILPANQVTTYQGQTIVPATAGAAAGAQMYVQQQPGVIQTIQTPQPMVQTYETVQQPAQMQVMTQPQFQGQAVAGFQPMAIGGAVSAVATA